MWQSTDPAIGEFLDGRAGLGGIYNPNNLSVYAYAHNNPVKLVDPDGKKVYVVFRRLNFFAVGGLGVHSYILLLPDNPEDFGGKKRTTLSGYKIEEGYRKGYLRSSSDYPVDYNWDLKDTKGVYEIKTPEGMTDTQFINNVIESFRKYKTDSRQYKEYPTLNMSQGNCHNVTTGALEGGGVNSSVFSKMDVFGAKPGLGESLPEMLPGRGAAQINPTQRTSGNSGSSGMPLWKPADITPTILQD